MSQLGEDQDIFASATAPEAVEPEPTGEIIEDRAPEDQAVSNAIRSLNRPSGRTTAQPAPAPRPSQEETPAEDRTAGGYLQGMLNERERRQELQQQLARYQEMERQRAREAEQQRTPSSELMFRDPDAWQAELERRVTEPLLQRMAQLQLDADFKMAQIRHSDVWGEAYNAWFKQVEPGNDPLTYFRIMNAPSPGDAIVEWFGERKVLEDIGNDPASYRQRVIEEYLASQGAAPPLARDNNGRFTPRPQAPRLPTATSRMGSTGNGFQGVAEDGSDAAIFAAGRPEPRQRR
jgi:hypothetical protein